MGKAYIDMHGTCSAKKCGQMFVLQAVLALLGGSVIQDVVHQLGQLVGTGIYVM